LHYQKVTANVQKQKIFETREVKVALKSKTHQLIYTNASKSTDKMKENIAVPPTRSQRLAAKRVIFYRISNPYCLSVNSNIVHCQRANQQPLTVPMCDAGNNIMVNLSCLKKIKSFKSFKFVNNNRMSLLFYFPFFVI